MSKKRPAEEASLRVSDFDYELPRELIAQHPLPRRDDSRMMVVERATGRISHHLFKDFPGFLDAGDLLVMNDTRVRTARVYGERGGARLEFLFVKELAPGLWETLCRPARRLKARDRVRFGPGFEAFVEEVGQAGRRVLRFGQQDVAARLRHIGFAPLPPYIRRKAGDLAQRPEDLERYQTVFARSEGAIAAPTAGFHFTWDTLGDLKAKGVKIRNVTLEIGLATFEPVPREIVKEHKMLDEWYSITRTAAREINVAMAVGTPVAAVGTTVVRTLESAWEDGRVRSGQRASSLFIYPGFKFHVVDRLLTNFHLPKSTLLMLVAAFAGRDLIRRAYLEAIKERYRFFSFGDCMLIL